MLVLSLIIGLLWTLFIIHSYKARASYNRLKRVCYRNRYGIVDHQIRQYRREFAMTFQYRLG